MITETQFKEIPEDFGSKLLEIQKMFKNFEFLQLQIQINKKKIDENKSFNFTVLETRFERTLLDDYYQMCMNCQKMCCQGCKWPSYAAESQCTHFSGGRECPFCANCPKFAHVKCNYLDVRKEYEVQKVYTSQKQMSEEGQADLSKFERALSIEKIKMVNLAKELFDIIQKLEMKAIIYEEYLEKMIKHEEESKKPEWQASIESLKGMCGRAQYITNISKPEDVWDLFPQYNLIKI